MSDQIEKSRLPAYDDAAYAIDAAIIAADMQDWESVRNRVVEALDSTSTSPFPHLNHKMHVYVTGVVLGLNSSTLDDELVAHRLENLREVVEDMIHLEVTGKSLFRST